MAVRLFVVAGGGARPAVTALLADQRVRIIDSPRHADVVLVVGAVPTELGPALQAVHDQTAAPRAVRWWTAAGDGRVPALPGIDHAEVVADRDPVPALEAAADAPPQPLLGADEPPSPWRGEGPYGTGGEGMMGGVPYGRPMTMTGEDLRDGLALDRLQLTVGPLLSPLPTGLVLDVALQGDVIVDAQVGDDPFASAPQTWRGAPPPIADTFAGIWDTPRDAAVPVAEVERARARHHLGAVARTLRLAGLDALARRTARLALGAGSGSATGGSVRRLDLWLRRTTAVRWLLHGVGHIEADVAGRGVAARAAGMAVDARTDHPPYQDLGFSVITHADGDADARLRQRLAEAAQSLDLAAAAGDRSIPGDAIEGPTGPVADAGAGPVRLLERLPAILLGMEWGDAVTTIDSLDLDLAALARERRVAAS